ncbi:MAG: hypothetical protein ACLGJD_05545 [Gammaproteobacteria bacterium]
MLAPASDGAGRDLIKQQSALKPEGTPALASAVTVLPAVEDGAGRDLVNQLLGQAQMASSFSMFSQTVATTKLATVKENKLYQQLKGMRAPNGLVLSGTWVEFCGLLGMSDEKANQDIANVRAFGEQALEQMQRAGIGYRELRQFRRLPDDERAALTELAAAGDKDALLDLAESIIAKHSKEKLALQEDAEELRRQQTKLVVERDTVIAERDGLAKKLRRRERDAEDHEGTPLVVADMRAEGAALLKKAELALGGLYPLGVEVVGLASADAADWIKPSLRLVLSGIVALRLQADGLIAQYAKALGDDARKLASQPDALAFLDETEIKTVAEDWARLVAVNQHEAALRAHERKQAKPRGKGRPEKAPQAPDGV